MYMYIYLGLGWFGFGLVLVWFGLVWFGLYECIYLLKLYVGKKITPEDGVGMYVCNHSNWELDR